MDGSTASRSAAPRNRSDGAQTRSSGPPPSLPLLLPLIARPSLPQVDLPTECINSMALLHSASTAAQQFGQNMMNAAPPALTDNSAPAAADGEFMTDSGSPHLSPALQLLADVSGSAGSQASPSRRNQLSSVPSDEWTAGAPRAPHPRAARRALREAVRRQ